MEKQRFIELLKNDKLPAKLAYQTELSDIEVVSGGLTNSNFSMVLEGKKYMVRFSGVATEDFISRSQELHNESIAYKLGLSPDLYLLDVESGAKISEFVDGAYVYTLEDCRKAEFIDKFVEKIKVLHQSQEKFEGVYDYLEKYETYKAIAMENLNPADIWGEDFVKVETDFFAAVAKVSEIGWESCNCHNDILAGNLILDRQQKLFIVDYEYSATNDICWDIASYITECELDASSEKYLLEAYFGTCSDQRLEKGRLEKIACQKAIYNMLWGMWALAKFGRGEDSILEFGIERYARLKYYLGKLDL